MSTSEQAMSRRGFIGGSDAAAALDMNPYLSAVELWERKTGRAVEFSGNDATHWGKLLEGVVRQEYAERTGRVVRLPERAIMHATVPYVGCHPDGITDDGRLYEGKTARFADGWGESGTDEIPHHYLIQVQHNMMCCQLSVAEVAVLIGGQEFRLYEIPADRELQESILDGEIMFWQHVERDEPPAIDLESPGALEILKRLYTGTNGRVLTADEECERHYAAYLAATAQCKAADTAAKMHKAALLAFMEEAAVLKFKDGKCLRRQLMQRKGYVVDPTQFIDTRFVAVRGV
jgi:putative phage-type endonuclease